MLDTPTAAAIEEEKRNSKKTKRKRPAKNRAFKGFNLDWTAEGRPAKDQWEAFLNTIRKHTVEEEALQWNFLQYFYQQECIFKYKLSYGGGGGNGSTEETADDPENGG
jgi:hypothetical protein